MQNVAALVELSGGLSDRAGASPICPVERSNSFVNRHRRANRKVGAGMQLAPAFCLAVIYVTNPTARRTLDVH